MGFDSGRPTYHWLPMPSMPSRGLRRIVRGRVAHRQHTTWRPSSSGNRMWSMMLMSTAAVCFVPHVSPDPCSCLATTAGDSNSCLCDAVHLRAARDTSRCADGVPECVFPCSGKSTRPPSRATRHNTSDTEETASVKQPGPGGKRANTCLCALEARAPKPRSARYRQHRANERNRATHTEKRRPNGSRHRPT